MELILLPLLNTDFMVLILPEVLEVFKLIRKKPVYSEAGIQGVESKFGS